MKTKTGLIAAAVALGIAAPMAMSVPAYAQCQYGERVDGTTAEMARARAQSAGYTNVVMTRKGCDSYWHGIANQGGARVGIVVSPAGQVMTESRLEQPPGMEGGTSYIVGVEPAQPVYPQTVIVPVYPQTAVVPVYPQVVTPGYTERAIPDPRYR
jgi:hypothetical protein